MIDFTETLNQRIQWTTPGSQIIGLTQKTILMWMLPDTTPAASRSSFSIVGNSAANESTLIAINASAQAGKVGFDTWFQNTTVEGFWRTNSAVLTAGVLAHIGVTYDAGSASNDPIIYINGEAVAITEISTPSGTWTGGTSSNLYLGGAVGYPVATPPDGKILSVCYYNRILSATEILEAYNSRKAIPTYNGLVFAPQLNGAAGLQTFGGATLAAGNTIVDSISGALGVPAGSPVGVGDTILTY